MPNLGMDQADILRDVDTGRLKDALAVLNHLPITPGRKAKRAAIVREIERRKSEGSK